jgi:hypothetical protein
MKNDVRMERIQLLPKELSSKIFYYVGNTNRYVQQFKKVVYMLNNNKNTCEKDEMYSYSSFIKDDEYFLDILYRETDKIGTLTLEYRKKMNLSKAILLAITRKYCFIMEENFQKIVLTKLNFNLFNIKFIDDDDNDLLDDENRLFRI